MSELTIYARLRAAGMTAAGACGVMGNMYAESGMQSNIAQRGMTSLSDAEYTAAADNGTINFAYDAVGYGLCQWTYYSRKLELWDFAHNRGKSVGDEETQVDFCLYELKAYYSGLWALLCSVDDVYTAASEVCTIYERPAVNNVAVRAREAQGYYDTYASADYAAIAGKKEISTVVSVEASTEKTPLELTTENVMHIQVFLVARGYDIGTSNNPSGVDGYIGKKTVAAAKDFVSRLEALL